MAPGMAPSLPLHSGALLREGQRTTRGCVSRLIGTGGRIVAGGVRWQGVRMHDDQAEELLEGIEVAIAV